MSISSGKCLNLLFHDVCESGEVSGFQNPGALVYKHSRQQFFDYLDVVSKTIDFANGAEKNPNKDVMLTFDDGGVSSLWVAKVLAQRGIKGIFFITTSRLGTSGFLNESQLRAIVGYGHTIGSHSHSHAMPFRDLSFDQLVEEWSASRKILERILGKSVVIASVPGGDLNVDVIKAASYVGIRQLYTSEPTIRPWMVESVVCHGRFSVKRHTHVQTVGNWVNHRHLWVQFLVRRLKNFVRIWLRPLYLVILDSRKSRDLS